MLKDNLYIILGIFVKNTTNVTYQLINSFIQYLLIKRTKYGKKSLEEGKNLILKLLIISGLDKSLYCDHNIGTCQPIVLPI